jgi:23S rRNA (cytosine1962-C5)-methyltransferase
VREQNRPGQPGELAVVFDRKDQFLAIGLFDPGSPIRLRVLHAGKPQTIDAAWWTARLAATVARRRGLFDERTTGFRLINGESDGWPGLILDRYDTTLVLKIYTAAWLSRLADLSRWIQSELRPERIVLRLSRNLQENADAEKRDGEILHGPPVSGPVVFLETGLRFEADVLRGQKTGFFLDQRENRRKVELLARGRTVLNAFAFSGGFSLYAARGGASSATDLDISAHALESARRNFALNQTDAHTGRCHHEPVQADAFDWLNRTDRQFDLIVLDPPSFARREAERAGAIRAYERLASLGVARLARGGVLLACSCSAHVSAEEFFGAVRRSAEKSARKFQELETTRHAPDHLATFKEADYLKGIYLRF